MKIYNSMEDQQPWVTTQYLGNSNEQDDRQKPAPKSNLPEDQRLANIARNCTTILK